MGAAGFELASSLNRSVHLFTKAGELQSSHDHLTPLTEEAIEALKHAQDERAAIGEVWVLASPTDDSEPVSRHLLRDWWYRAEEQAGLVHIDGLGWHGLRRKFADEHREVPLRDPADLGGWKTPRTILEVYRDSDIASMRRAQRQRQSLGEGREVG